MAREVDAVDSAGVRKLSGMTSNELGLWFELSLGAVVQMQYWADRRLVRVDKLA